MPYDQRLIGFLTARNEADRQKYLERLVHDVIEPQVLRMVRRNLGASAPMDDRDDVCAEALFRIVRQLRKFVEAPDSAPSNLIGYVSEIASHTVADHFREHRPLRDNVRLRLHHLARKTEGLRVWSDGGASVCGLAAWESRPAAGPDNTALTAFAADPLAYASSVLPHGMTISANPGRLLRALVEAASEPLLLSDLIDPFAAVWGMQDTALVSTEDSQVEEPVAHVDVAKEVLLREEFAVLWKEIRSLPSQQAAALLLNLRDTHRSAYITLLTLNKITSIPEIADAVALPAEDLYRLWNDLPIRDERIAALLGIMPSRVISCRKAAQERLGRRLRRLGWSI